MKNKIRIIDVMKFKLSELFSKSFQNFREDYLTSNLGTKNQNFILFFSNFLLSFLIFILRKPDSILNAQLWAEDGQIFLRDEWVTGFPDTFFFLYAGYIHLVPRFIAFFANLFPYTFIPLVFNLCAILISAISVSIFSLTKFRYILKSDFLRTIVIVLLCCSPVGIESFNNITNVHFFLSLGVFLLAIIGGELNGFSYLLISVYVLLGIFSAPLAICYAPLFLIRPFLCKFDRKRWVYLVLFVIGLGYGILMFYLGSRDSVVGIDWNYFLNPIHIEKLIRLIVATYFMNTNSVEFITYHKYFWILEVILLYFYIKKFKMQGFQTSILLGGFLITVLIPVLLRGGLSLNEEQASYTTLVNGAKESFYFLNVINLMINRYGLVPYFMFCILTFVLLFDKNTTQSTIHFPILIVVVFLFVIRNSIFIKPYVDLRWDQYADMVKNKTDVSIPVNPIWFPKIEFKKELWKRD
ncbi:hypothetical protein LFX15_00675 [Leptospira levettii]|uniref:hypothetical protein n=1 Tax=Leptospira levettii TaxID=2023178 RepID=UPI001EEA6719|nr:hypothetical protein [Leptospira levettii]MCG6146783.1 hypothetical protein [Leptospira levettii]